MNKSSTTLFNFKTLKHTVLAKTNFYLQNAPNGLKISNLFFQGPNKTSIQKKPLSNLTLQEWVKVLKEICQMAKVEKYSQFSHMFFFIIFLDLSKPPPWKSAFLHTLFLQNKEQPSEKNYRTMFFRQNETHMAKFSCFWALSKIAENQGDVLACGLSFFFQFF